MEALVFGEEALGEAVPPVAKFVDLGGLEEMDQGKGDQLNAGRSDRIEARQLTSACGESQRKRLVAVSEEITPSEVVAGVEIVVDLSDHAVQPIAGWRNYGRVRLAGRAFE